MLKKIDKSWTRHNRKAITVHQKMLKLGAILCLGGIFMLILCTYVPTSFGDVSKLSINFGVICILGLCISLHAEQTIQIFKAECRILDALKVDHGIEEEDFEE